MKKVVIAICVLEFVFLGSNARIRKLTKLPIYLRNYILNLVPLSCLTRFIVIFFKTVVTKHDPSDLPHGVD